MNLAKKGLTIVLSVAMMLSVFLCFGSMVKVNAEGAFPFSSSPSAIDEDYEIIDNGGSSTVMREGVLSFVDIDASREVMLISKTELTAPYTIEFSMFSNTDGYPDGVFVIGHDDYNVGGDQIETGGGLYIDRSAGSLVPWQGTKIYQPDGVTEATGNFINSEIGWAINRDFLYKFEVLENGHVNVYYDFADTPDALTTLRKIIKPADGSDLEITKSGYFVFVPLVQSNDNGKTRTLKYISENGNKSIFNTLDENKWNIVGNAEKAVIAADFSFIDKNETTVASKFIFTDEGLNDGDTVFDITFRSSRLHGATSPTWGIAFGMKDKDMPIASADRYELSRLNGQAYKGSEAQTNNNGKPYATNIYNIGGDVTIRLVGRKDGTLEEYRGIGAAGNVITDLYTTYSGFDFNGYIAFYSRAGADSVETDSVSYKDIAISGNAVKVQIKTAEGASIRLNAPNGLRFETRIDKADYDALVATYGAENVKTGTIILPADYLSETYLTGDKFDLNAYILASTEGTDYKNIKNQLGFYNEDTASADGYYLYYGSLVEIQTENLTRDFVGVGYVSITSGDNTIMIYGGNSISAHSRNISEIALLAYNDRSSVQTEKYCYEVSGEGNYSPYSPEILELISGFIVE